MSGGSVTSHSCPWQKINASRTQGSGEALAAGAGVAVRTPLAEHHRAVGFRHVPKIPLSQQRDAKVL